MKVTIDGHRFDTNKASHHWPLYYWDGNNNSHGDVYRSSNGLFYVWTPSQWSNRHSWLVMEPAEILNDYDRHLTEEQKEEIAEVAGLTWE